MICYNRNIIRCFFLLSFIMISINTAHASGIFNNNPDQAEKKQETSALPANSGLPEPVKQNVVQIKGTVRLVGNEPFTELVITGNITAQESGNPVTWHISIDERYKLHNLQQRTVTVKGEESIIEMTFASGIPAGIRRELRNISIISIE